MEQYDFDTDLKFQEFLELIEYSGDNELLDRAKQYFYQKCVLKNDEVSIAVNQEDKQKLSLQSFFQELAKNPDIDITRLPGFMPIREISKELSKEKVDFALVKSPAKPWESS